MKAVNLIPADERRGAGGAGGRTAGGAYILIGALALVVAMLAAYATTSKSINDQRSQLAKVQREAAVSEGKAAELAPYTAFAALRTARVATVKSIAESRFDWAHAMREVGRTLPQNVTLTSLAGSVSTSSAGAGGGGVALRAAYDVPAIELAGCVPSQAAIPPMLVGLRRIDGVRRVALQQSIKGAGAAPATATAPGGKPARAADCSRSFQAVVFFDAKTPAALAAAPGAVPAAATAGPAQNPDGGAK